MRYSILVLLVACDQGIINDTVGGGKDTSEPVSPDPDIKVNVTEVDFGEVQYGKLYQQYVTITNVGAADLEVSNITTDDPFTANPLSVTIAAGSATQVTVAVTSNAWQDLSADLTLESNDPDGPVVIALKASTIVDADGDGYDRVESGGNDCDDNDNRVNPGASEIWYDDIDQNCDGASDHDQDGDGYETDDHNEDPFDGGGDCQDSNVEYYPGAPDVPYDNRDTNCDGADDYDYDGDGSRSADYGAGLDCDDNDADVNISSDEQLNGKDDDCDGVVDVGAELDQTEYMYVGKGSYDQAGYSIALGDLDADDLAEVVVGAPYYNAGSAGANGRGMVAIFQGGSLPASPGDLRDAAYDIQGDGSADGLGFFVTVLGDFDGSGTDDLAISAGPINSNGGAVYVIDGDDVMRGRDLGDSLITVSGSSSQYAGRGIGTDIDLDGDGLQDLLLAYSNSGSNAVALEYGGGSGSLSISGTDAQWSYSASSDVFYRNLPAGADLDGDGYQDLLFSDGTVDSPSTDAGSAWIVWGSGSRYSGSQSFTSVSTIVGQGASSSVNFGHATQAGDDLTGDGIPDLWMYTQDVALYAFEGGAYLRSSRVDTADALVTYTWDSSTEDVDVLRRGGDFSGDGIDDMFIGLPDESYGGVMWIDSELCCDGSTYAIEDIYGGFVTGLSDNENGLLGWGMAPLGADIDGDGDKDYAAGDPEKLSSSSSKEGEAYIFMNEYLAE